MSAKKLTDNTKPKKKEPKKAAAKETKASKPVAAKKVAAKKPEVAKKTATSKSAAKPAAASKPAVAPQPVPAQKADAKKTVTTTKPATPQKSTSAAKPAVAPKPGGKRKLVVSYKNLPADVIELLKEKYPKGYSDVLIKVDKGNGQFFYGVTLDTEDTDYLIKVDVKIDSEPEEIERALFGGGDQQDQGGDEDFPDDEGSFDQAEEEE